MSLEIFPTYPKLRAEQLDQIDWAEVTPLINLINAGDANTLSQALAFANLDPAVANVLSQVSQSANAVRNIVNAQYLDPLVANRVNTTGTQTRAAIEGLILATATGLQIRGEVSIGSINWNTLTQPGVYIGIASGSGGSNVPPWPLGEMAAVIVAEFGSYAIQLLIGGHSTALRRRVSNTWGQWEFRTSRFVARSLSSNINIGNTYANILSVNPASEMPLVASSSGAIYARVHAALVADIGSDGFGGTTRVRIAWQNATRRVAYHSRTTGTIGHITLNLHTGIVYNLDSTGNSISLQASDTVGVTVLASLEGAPATYLLVEMG